MTGRIQVQAPLIEEPKKLTVDELVEKLQGYQKDGLGSAEVDLDLNLPFKTREFYIKGVTRSHHYEKDLLDDEYRHAHTSITLDCFSDVLHS